MRCVGRLSLLPLGKPFWLAQTITSFAFKSFTLSWVVNTCIHVKVFFSQKKGVNWISLEMWVVHCTTGTDDKYNLEQMKKEKLVTKDISDSRVQLTLWYEMPCPERGRTWLWRERMTLDLVRTILVGKGTCSKCPLLFQIITFWTCPLQAWKTSEKKGGPWLWRQCTRVKMTLDLARTIREGKGTCSNQMSSDYHLLKPAPWKRKKDLDSGVSVLVWGWH